MHRQAPTAHRAARCARGLDSSRGAFCSGDSRINTQPVTRRRSVAACSSHRRLDIQAVGWGSRAIVNVCAQWQMCSLHPIASNCMVDSPGTACLGSNAADDKPSCGSWYWHQVIPMLAGDATDQTPPDLPSFLFKERIVYLVRDLYSSDDLQNLLTDFSSGAVPSFILPQLHPGSIAGR